MTGDASGDQEQRSRPLAQGRKGRPRRVHGGPQVEIDHLVLHLSWGGWEVEVDVPRGTGIDEQGTEPTPPRQHRLGDARRGLRIHQVGRQHRARPVVSTIWAAVASRRALVRATTAISAPACPNSRAAALPIPLPAPAITVTRPSSGAASTTPPEGLDGARAVRAGTLAVRLPAGMPSGDGCLAPCSGRRVGRS